MYSLIVKNAKIIDGTGKPAFSGDIAIQGDEIVNIAETITSSAQTILDAEGAVVAPGFIDIQNHSDSYWQLFDNPGLGSLITQGYTSIIIGNCGASLAPLLSHEALLSIQKWHTLEGVNINWQSFSEYIEELARHRYGCNVGSMVGYSTLRRGIIGDQIRSLESGELASLKRILEDSLSAGAFGLSSGLSYSHELIISEIELYELAKVVQKNNGLFSIHLRNEGAEIVEAVEEALDITRNTGVNLKISHLKVRGQDNWKKYTEVMENLEMAFHRGTNVHFDVYPYDTIWQPLYSYLPKWASEGGREVMLKHFADPTQKNKILTHLNNSGVRFPQLIVASITNRMNVIGKTIGQIAKNMEVSSEQAVLHLIENGGSEVLVFEQNLDPSQVRSSMFHPLAFIGTDGGGFDDKHQGNLVHPRCFGTASKFLNEALTTKRITLEEAIRKLTFGPAQKLGLKRRGTLAVGNYADLVVFDPEKIADRSTYENPFQYSSGIHYVLVNGKAAVIEGKPTGELGGYALRKI